MISMDFTRKAKDVLARKGGAGDSFSLVGGSSAPVKRAVKGAVLI